MGRNLWERTVLRREDDRLTRYTRAEGLFDNVIPHIVEDRSGNSGWAATAGFPDSSPAESELIFAYGLPAKLRRIPTEWVEGCHRPKPMADFSQVPLTDLTVVSYFPTVEGRCCSQCP